MAYGKGRPSHNKYSSFVVESGFIVDVDSRFTCTVETEHSGKTVPDVHILVPYHHPEGEGFHYLPEVGSFCYIAWPSDNNPPFVLGYRGVPRAISTEQDHPHSDEEGNPPATDVTYQSSRPDLNPGDIALTGRDGNYLYLRRGGILQLGSTPLCQRVYIPVTNLMRDICENHQLLSLAGDVEWSVDRIDSNTDSPTSYQLRVRDVAQSKDATVMVRHMTTGDPRYAWEVVVCPQKIDLNGEFSSPTYHLKVDTEGNVEELVESRSLEVAGDDTLKVGGDRVVEAANIKLLSDGDAILSGQTKAVVDAVSVKLGEGASYAAVRGDILKALLQIPLAVSGTTAMWTPAHNALLNIMLSTKVTVE